MAHLSLSQSFLVFVSKLAVSLQPASPLSPPFSPPHQHLASLLVLRYSIYIPSPAGQHSPAADLRAPLSAASADRPSLSGLGVVVLRPPSVLPYPKGAAVSGKQLGWPALTSTTAN